MHSTEAGDDKIRQDRGFPEQNPAAVWVGALGTFFPFSPRSKELSKWHLMKYSEDLGSKNYWSHGQLQRAGKDIVLQLPNQWWLNTETDFTADSEHKSQVGGKETQRPLSPSSHVPGAVFS